MKIAPHPQRAMNVKFITPAEQFEQNRAAVEKIVIDLKPEAKISLLKYTPLTPDEYRFLSGLLLYQQGDKCAVAVGLFHDLAKMPKYEAEGNYYLAMCSKKLGLTSDFIE